MFRVTVIPIHQDNYVWLIRTPDETWVVDPGLAPPVLEYLSNHRAALTGILITHRHWDHVNGIQQLIEAQPVPVFGPDDPAIPLIDRPVRRGDQIRIGKQECAVLETPGHTREHVSFHLPDVHVLFSGDTLFSVGCGRVADGSHESLFASLRRIATLSPLTRVYGAHEYTLQNIDFALSIEPDNPDLLDYQRWCVRHREQDLPTLPTTVGWEIRVNPFLRTGVPEVQRRVAELCDMGPLDEFETFRQLRLLKNRY